ncbi:hypothetical protein OSB04_018443 [Centaurea solstitialis]|uniref:ATPase AAA-type core domain-containing protein n=1 Tax=Centaurea solstitialis TaxID=347529 RepID=A0AA38T4V5_9ASTR|nr:hypothetical protein OSB04_018443 [Centaurea solstitialis]
MRNDAYVKHGIEFPGFFLLIGDPETFMAKAVVGESSSEVSFLSVCAGEYEDVGFGPAGIEDLFYQAKDKQPSIIFIDQLETIGQAGGTQLHPSLKQV